jgi:hypothetical protein
LLIRKLPGYTRRRTDQHGRNEQRTSPAMAEPRQKPVTIRTIAEIGDHSQLYAYCDACRHRRQLDLAALRERYGPQLPLKRLQGRLCCSHYGARRRLFTFGMPDPTPELSLGFSERFSRAHQLAIRLTSLSFFPASSSRSSSASRVAHYAISAVDMARK